MGKLTVGTAKICISPTKDMFPFDGPEYLGGGIKIEDVYFDEYIRMLALSNGKETYLFGSFEESNGTDALKDVITEKYGIPYKNQMFCQIHNHGGVPVPTITKPGRGSKKHHTFSDTQKRLGQRIFDKAVEAAGEALQNMRPARMGYGEGKSYISVNRDLPNDDGYWTQADNYDGPSDKTLAVLKFTDEEGNLIAALLNYGAHAITTIGATDVDGKLKTSADFPGFACDYLEKKYPGSIVMWTNAAAGDQNAICVFKGDQHYTETCNVAPSTTLPHGYQYCYSQYLGERHAVDADKVLRKLDCRWDELDIRSAVTDVYIPQQSPPANVNFWLNIALAQNNVSVVQKMAPEMVVDGKILGRSIDDYVPNGTSEDCELQMFVLGDVTIIAVAAELYTNLGKAIKEACPTKNAFVITVCGGHGNRVGYIQDTQSNTHKTFQHFGEAAPCDSNQIFTDGVKLLTKQVLG